MVAGVDTVKLDLETCECECWERPVSFVKLGLWPITPDKWVFVDFQFMFFVSVLQNTSPTTSLSSILDAVRFVHEFPLFVSTTINYCTDL